MIPRDYQDTLFKNGMISGTTRPTPWLEPIRRGENKFVKPEPPKITSIVSEPEPVKEWEWTFSRASWTLPEEEGRALLEEMKVHALREKIRAVAKKNREHRR